MRTSDDLICEYISTEELYKTISKFCLGFSFTFLSPHFIMGSRHYQSWVDLVNVNTCFFDVYLIMSYLWRPGDHSILSIGPPWTFNARSGKTPAPVGFEPVSPGTKTSMLPIKQRWLLIENYLTSLVMPQLTLIDMNSSISSFFFTNIELKNLPPWDSNPSHLEQLQVLILQFSYETKIY